MIQTIRNYGLIAIVAAAIGFGYGYERANKKMLETVANTSHQTATEIQQSLNKSLETEVLATESAQNVSKIRKAVSTRLKEAKKQAEEKEPQQNGTDTTCPPDAPTVPFDAGWRMDIGTVRMLNSARAGAAYDATGSSDAESKAPSRTGIAELIDNDLQIVEIYHDLAIRHDALVDWVERVLSKQAGHFVPQPSE